jgi:predicted esterase
MQSFILALLIAGSPAASQIRDISPSASQSTEASDSIQTFMSNMKPDVQPEQSSGSFYWLDPAFEALFEKPTYHYTGGGYKDRLFRYRLFVPHTNGPDDKRPLIVWLHGMGEAGDNNGAQLVYFTHLFFPPPWERTRYPFFVLAAQCPMDNRSWTTTSGDADDMVNVVAAILQKTIQEYPVDPARIMLSGVSSGGNGCWELAMRHPELFSAVAPLASAGGDASRVDRIVEIPVWVFNCDADKIAPIESVRRLVQALKQKGGNAELTEINSSSHDAWKPAFDDYDLLNWLLSQKRGDTSSLRPGTITISGHFRVFGNTLRGYFAKWSPWQIAAEIGIPVLVIVVVWSVRRQRQRQFQK